MVNIDKQLAVIEKAIAWGEKYEPNSFPFSLFKDSRRKLKKIRYALSEHCAAAAYGESQVGKSYLMSSLLSSKEAQFCVADGNGKRYSFINELNPSGGSNAKEESTGVITRFTTSIENERMKGFIRIRTLSAVDIVLMLSESYYKNVKIDTETVLDKNVINDMVNTIKSRYSSLSEVQTYITEDDIWDMLDRTNGFFRRVIGNDAVNVINSDFCNHIAPIITHIPVENWKKLFSLLWNNNQTVSDIFVRLIGELNRVGFLSEIFVPFDAVLKSQGTLLKVDWLEYICNQTKIPSGNPVTDVYNAEGSCIASQFSKAALSAITAELTFYLPEEITQEKPFLKHFDLLDFPGERRNENILEENLNQELFNMLKRGKVSYLFQKYSHALLINTVLFCQHQDMSGQSVIGETLNDWICNNIGENAEKRSNYIATTGRISPFFIVCTKFNTDLEWTNQTRETDLSERWKVRFDKTLSSEVIKSDTYSWFNKYVCTASGYNSDAFQSLYLLRDFFWSEHQQIFAGYKENVSGEQKEICPEQYPDYRNDLKESFINYPFVKKHFQDPIQAWNAAATLNHDGSESIIHDLDIISPQIDAARCEKYAQESESIWNELQRRLSEYYIPDDEIEKKENTRRIAGKLKLSLETLFAQNPASIGYVIDAFMIPSTLIRQEVYNVVIGHSDHPVDRAPIQVIWVSAGITHSDNKVQRLDKLLKHYACDSEQQLEQSLFDKNINLEDILKGEEDIPTTMAEVLVNHIYELWLSYISNSIERTQSSIEYADKLVFMFNNLFLKLNVKQTLLDTINRLMSIFDTKQLPDVISDATSLICNNFISSVGWQYFSQNDKDQIAKIADSLGLKIDMQQHGTKRSEMSLKTTLQAFDKAADIIRTIPDNALQTLRCLPWWDNFERWENLLVAGLVYTSDIVQCNQQANNSLKSIIESFN